MSMLVKVSRMPGKTIEVAIEDDSTVSTALEIAEVTAATNEKITVNGEPATLSTVLFDEDVVLLAKDAKSA